MAQTKPTKVNVRSFIAAVENETRRKDARALLKIFEEATGWKAKMWGPTVVGFGVYRYTYDTGYSGSSCVVGFSRRKALMFEADEILIGGWPWNTKVALHFTDHLKGPESPRTGPLVAGRLFRCMDTGCRGDLVQSSRSLLPRTAQGHERRGLSGRSLAPRKRGAN